MSFNKLQGFAPNRIQDYFATFAVVYGPALIFLALTIVANVYKGTSKKIPQPDRVMTPDHRKKELADLWNARRLSGAIATAEPV